MKVTAGGRRLSRLCEGGKTIHRPLGFPPSLLLLAWSVAMMAGIAEAWVAAPMSATSLYRNQARQLLQASLRTRHGLVLRGPKLMMSTEQGGGEPRRISHIEVIVTPWQTATLPIYPESHIAGITLCDALIVPSLLLLENVGRIQHTPGCCCDRHVTHDGARVWVVGTTILGPEQCLMEKCLKKV